MNAVYIVAVAVALVWCVGGIYQHKRRRNKTIHIIDNNCSGCQHCVKRCRHRVLDTVSDEKRTRVFVKNPHYCTACGDCLSACKFKALELIEKTAV
jgi:NAD-dependent dihydropyrimidine dehydrogenase PreA subunit